MAVSVTHIKCTVRLAVSFALEMCWTHGVSPSAEPRLGMHQTTGQVLLQSRGGGAQQEARLSPVAATNVQQ